MTKTACESNRESDKRDPGDGAWMTRTRKIVYVLRDGIRVSEMGWQWNTFDATFFTYICVCNRLGLTMFSV